MIVQNFIFATHNDHKLIEAKAILKELSYINIQSLNEINITEPIPEDFYTLEENALQKARFIFHRTGKNCFADDTGLFINYLQGKPGVFSARYAGNSCSFDDNIDKVLNEMKDASDRSAYFSTVIALCTNGAELLFEGRVNGVILSDRQGEGGFGYDPIFQPKGYSFSFASMSSVEKNKISHRGMAFEKLKTYLTKNGLQNTLQPA